MLTEDDYARIIGHVYIDAYTRIRSLEQQLAPLRESFQKQIDALRAQLREKEQGADAPLNPHGSLGA